MIRVLVVDDDFMVVKVHSGFVAAVPGFEIAGVADTGMAALQAVRDLRPDLVLLDIHLPDINGLTLLPMLREVRPDLDAIVITAAREADTVRQALRGGIVHYLIKPFTAADLRATLQHYQRSYHGLERDAKAAQQDVDAAFGPAGTARSVPTRLPKKLSTETAELVGHALRDADADLSATECADILGVARVSARRYLEYFVATGQAEVRLRYGGVGRPERRYLWAVSRGAG